MTFFLSLHSLLSLCNSGSVFHNFHSEDVYPLPPSPGCPLRRSSRKNTRMHTPKAFLADIPYRADMNATSTVLIFRFPMHARKNPNDLSNSPPPLSQLNRKAPSRFMQKTRTMPISLLCIPYVWLSSLRQPLLAAHARYVCFLKILNLACMHLRSAFIGRLL